MKWFKHQSNARNDERVAHLEQLAGLEGYGFYMKLLEIISESMDSTDKCSLTYSLSKWSNELYIHHNKVSALLGKCEVTGLVTVRYHEGNGQVRIEVIIPNLLKYRDNHTKNLQAACKQELDIDKELDTEKSYKEINKEKPTATASRLPKDWKPSDQDIEFAKRERPDIDLMVIADGFRDYWISVAGAKGRKLDWPATWRNWIRNTKSTNRSINDERANAIAILTGKNRQSESIEGFAYRVD